MELIPDEVKPALEVAYARSMETGESSQQILVKLFCPWADATWYISEGSLLDGDWHLFGFANLNNRQNAELGYVMLSELESVRGPFGMKIERDLYYGEHTLAEVMKEYGKSW